MAVGGFGDADAVDAIIYTAAELAYARPRSPWRLTASNTFTVPITLTSAPRGGSAAASGTRIAARWTT
jgi:hypothetical protein